MKSHVLSAALAAAAFLPSAFAHYNFESLIVNGEVSGPYEFVRRTKNSNSPVTDVTSPDIICNVGGIDDDVMTETGTQTVAPGDEVGFKINSNLGHPGPLAVYMSRAPGTAQEYKGDGDWFKVYELTTANLTSDPITWASFLDGGISDFTFTLPTDLPAGQYLMRGEHIGLHGAGEFGGAQFYIGCAQLEVTGTGAGAPEPVVQFPGAYDGNEPGILVGIYWPPLRSYTAPGPVTWPNACEDHTANFNGQTSDGDCTPLDEASQGDGTSPEEPPVDDTTPAPGPTSTAAPVPSATSGFATSALTPVATASSAATPSATPASSSAVAAPSPSSEPCSRRRRRRSQKSRKH